MSLFEIIKPAAAMVTQPVPMDPYASAVLNRILGLPRNAPVMECTLTGPVLKANQNILIALAAPEGHLGLPVWESIPVPAGETVDLRRLGGTSRIYFAVRSDGDEPSRFRLRTESLIRIKTKPDVPLSWADAEIQLTDQTFRILPASDRRGIRCQGAQKIKGGREIAPEPMTYGAIQLPPSGDPVIVGPDGPVTGGYRRVATVAFSGLRRLAWLMPGEQVRFTKITPEAALNHVACLEEALARDLMPC